MSESLHPQATFLHQEHAPLLEKMDDEEFWAYAAAYAQKVPAEQTTNNNFLVCDLHIFGCLLDLATLRVVVPSPSRVSLLPMAPSWMLGVTAWSGIPLAVVDLCTYLFGRDYKTSQAPSMLLVVQDNDILLGFSAPVIGMSTNVNISLFRSPDQLETEYVPPCAGAIKGLFMDGVVIGMDDNKISLVLDVPVILADMVQQLRMTAVYG